MQLRGIKLGIIQDGQQQAKNLIELANELKGNKNDIQVTMRRIEGLTQEGILNFKALQNIIGRINAVNKDLGIEYKIPQLAEMEKALSAWADANSLKI